MDKRINGLFVMAICMTMILIGFSRCTGEEQSKYFKAADEFIEWIGNETVLTPEELKEEVYFFVNASEPYRGEKIHVMYEAIPPAEWEERELGPWFERITGIKIIWAPMSNSETVSKSVEDAKIKAGIFDLVGSDQDMIGFGSYHHSILDLDAFMEEHPEMVPPHLDKEDFVAIEEYSDYKTGHWLAFMAYNGPHSTVYRKDWFTNPEYRSEFKERYGYELKTPMEYWCTAQETGNIEDDWTIKKATDCLEFFTRPDEDMWGILAPLKPGDHIGWLINDGFDDVFQLASPAPPGVDPINCSYFEPYIDPFGIRIEDGIIYGASAEHGGMLDSPAGIAMYQHYFNTLPKYSPSKGYEVGAVEAFMSFGLEGRYAMMYPSYPWFTFVYNSEDSKIKGKYEYGPIPVYAPNYEKGKPRGYIDPSGWIISNYSHHKEASFLFGAFMTSKVGDLKKNLEVGAPIRWSTINDPRFGAMDEEMGGVVTLMRTQMKEQYGTDPRWVIYPHILSVASVEGADCMGRGLSGEETAHAIAKAIDDWLIDNGWMEKNLYG